MIYMSSCTSSQASTHAITTAGAKGSHLALPNNHDTAVITVITVIEKHASVVTTCDNMGLVARDAD